MDASTGTDTDPDTSAGSGGLARTTEQATPLASSIGAAVRTHRTRVGWSMRELARRASVSQPFLSNVENGRVSPSVSSLYALAGALGVSPSALMPPIGAADDTVAAHLPTHDSDGSTHVRVLSAGDGRMLEGYLFDVAADYADPAFFEHDGEDLVHVLAGAVVLERPGHDDVPVEAGGSLWVDGRTPHRWRAAATAEKPHGARFLLTSANRSA